MGRYFPVPMAAVPPKHWRHGIEHMKVDLAPDPGSR